MELAAIPDAQARLEDRSTQSKTHSGEDGRFELSGRPPLDGLWIVGSAEGFWTRRMAAVLDKEHKLELPWLGEVHGIVKRLGSGQPLAGVDLVAYYRGPASRSTSDASGLYRLTCPTRESVVIGVVDAEHPPWLREVYLRQGESKRLDIELEVGTEVVVQLLDAVSRHPVPDATVGFFGAAELPLTTSDASGRLRLRSQAEDDRTFEIEAEGYLPLVWTCSLPETDEEIVLPMVAPGWVVGRVVDHAGDPISGAQVGLGGTGNLVQGAPDEFPGFEGLTQRIFYGFPAESNARTNDEGAFEVLVTPSSSGFELLAQAEGYAVSTKGPLFVSFPGEHLQVDLVLQPEARIHGRLTLGGEPWTGLIQALASDGRGIRSVAPDESGEYEITGLNADRWTISYHDVDTTQPKARIQIDVTAGESYEHNFDWEAAASSISGTVRTAAGRPVPDADVRALCVGCPHASQLHATTSDDGSYSIPVDADLVFNVATGWNHDLVEVFDVPSGATGVDLVQKRKGVLRLRLVESATGRPVSLGVRSSVWWNELSWRPAAARDFLPCMGNIDLDGILELELPLGRGDLDVAMTWEGYVARRVPDLGVREDPDPKPITVELERGVELILNHAHGFDAAEGHVLFVLAESQLNHVDGPFAVAEPGTVQLGDAHFRLASRSLRSQYFHGEEGVTELHGLFPGTYHVVAFPDDLVFEPASFVVEGPERVEVELRCRPR